MDEEDDELGEEDDPDWEILQHLTPEQRQAVNALVEDARDDALDQLRIELFETQGIMFGQGAVDGQGQAGDEQTARNQEAEDLDELFEILQPMMDSLPELPTDAPNFAEAMQEQLLEYTTQRVHQFLQLLDQTYDATAHIIAVDFDRERIHFVAQQLIGRIPNPPVVGDNLRQLPTDADMERLLLAVLPHVIIRANLQHIPEDAGAEQADGEEDELYAGPDGLRDGLAVPSEALRNMEHEGHRDGSPSSEPEDTDPTTPMDDPIVAGASAEPGDTAFKEGTGTPSGPPGGWPGVDEELD